jgi:hypothetical protein
VTRLRRRVHIELIEDLAVTGVFRLALAPDIEVRRRAVIALRLIAPVRA